SWSHQGGTLRLWSSQGTELAVLQGHEHEVNGVQVLTDGRLLSWSRDSTLRVWTGQGTELAVLQGHEGGVNGAQELADGRLLSWSAEGRRRLWTSQATGLAVRQGNRDAGWGCRGWPMVACCPGAATARCACGQARALNWPSCPATSAR